MHDEGRIHVAPIADALAREDWPVLVALPVVASVFVFAAPRLGWWAFALAGLVYAAGFVAYERARHTERTYHQLAVALGRLPELSGVVPEGRSERMAELASAVASHLNLSPRDVAAAGSAARCAGLGRVGDDAWPHLRAGFDDRAAARWTAIIVGRAPGLEPLAPLLGPVAPPDPSAARVRSIVDLVAAYDEAVHAGGLDHEAALEKIAETGRGDVVAAIGAAALSG